MNGKILTYSTVDGVYKVFGLKNYRILYSISDKNVQKIIIGPRILLLTFPEGIGHVPLKILSIEDGTVLKSFNHLLCRNKQVDFIEPKILVKQEDENLQILDVRNSELTEVSRTQLISPSAFIFLYVSPLFLTLINRKVAVWNFQVELVTTFEDYISWHPDRGANEIYITSDEQLIISFCKANPNDRLSQRKAGSINISNILTEKSIAKITANISSIWNDYCCSANCRGRICKPPKRIRASKGALYQKLWKTLQLFSMMKNAMKYTLQIGWAWSMCGLTNKSLRLVSRDCILLSDGQIFSKTLHCRYWGTVPLDSS